MKIVFDSAVFTLKHFSLEYTLPPEGANFDSMRGSWLELVCT